MLKLFKFMTRSLKNQQAKALIEQSQELHKQQRFDEAIEACRKAVDLQPERPWYHNELALALTRRGDYFFNPDLAEAMRQNGELDEAIAEFRRALDLGWEGHWFNLCLGQALTVRGDFEAASQHLRLATDIKTREHFPDHYAKYGDSGTPKGPDFVIIGATKCGTTSLYEYMKDHPQVLPAIWKEIEYYRFPERGHDWYLSHFPRIPDGDTRFITGEASTCYIGMREAQPLMREQYPNVKLMALARDPVDKAISHCHHDRKLGVESRTVEEALNRELDILESVDSLWPYPGEYWDTERGYVWHGLYAYFIQSWVDAFSPEQMLVIPSEDLYGKPAETLTRVYDYLELPDHQLDNYEVHLKGDYDKSKQDPVRERLKRFFAPHNERLEELMGRKLDWQRPS
ncbi:MAG: sulfotransferase domain-containing protein [bacterium]|nr:sulfotransferase domain-containing protein [bacterium]